jgi:hypothetical protein
MRRAHVLAVLAFLTLGDPAAAATLHVPGDYPSVLEAVDATAPGDTVLIGPGRWTDKATRSGMIYGLPGTYTCCGFLKGGITLIGEAGAAATIIDAEATGVGYVCTFLYANYPGEEVVLEDLTITGGVARAAGGNNCGRVVIRSCRIVDNTALGEGTAIKLATCDLLLEDSEVSHNVSTYWAGVRGLQSDMEIVRCRFEGNVGMCVHNSYGSTLILDSAFIDNRHENTAGVGIRSQDWVQVERCLFLRNVTTDGPGGGMSVTDSNGRIAFNTFAYDSTYGGWEGGGLATAWFTGEIVGNTFVGCHNDAPYHGSAVSIHSNTSVTFRNNIIAESTGGYSVRLLGDLDFDNGWNVLWNNETGNGGYPVQATDQFLDPQLCDPRNGNFHVAASSPCLAQNTSGVCGQIGAHGEGCESQGTVVVALVTTPEDIEILVDGSTWRAPVLFSWWPGDSHAVQVPSIWEGTPGTRYEFSHWEDGGDAARTIVVPAVPSLYKAVYDTLHYLDMQQAEPGGSVTPEDGYYLRFSWVPICATPDSGCWFIGWTGQGLGSYTGEDSSAVVQIGGPITQVASFRKNVDVTIASDPPGRTVIVDGESCVAPSSFVWESYSAHTVSVDSIQAEGVSTRYRFASWSDGGARSHTITVPWDPLTVTADFVTEHMLTFETHARGTASPGDGWQVARTAVEIEAMPDPYYVFTDWEGTGSGSYTGTANPATVVIRGPVHEDVGFFRISHQVALSLSDSDPSVCTGAPLGFGFVYLWLACSTEGGLRAFEADLTGTMQVYAFTPAPGILNGGDATHLELASPNCLEGPVLLGSFVVQDDGGGSLCLVPSASHGLLGGQDCTGFPGLSYEWPVDMRVTGVATDGREPCDSGRACDQDAPVDPVAVVEQPPEAIAHSTAFEWSRPNPFSSETELRFTLAHQTHVMLSIYDVAGRLVRRLIDEERDAGQHNVTWSGRDRDGRALPSGVYFSQLIAGDYVRARKLVLLPSR